MALASTTLNAQLEIGAQFIAVASITGITAGMFAQCDGEQMRVSKNWNGANPVTFDMRGISTLSTVHVSGARIVFGLGSDFSNPAPTTLTTLSEYPGQDRFSVNATAIAIPNPSTGRDLYVSINGAGALASTIINPTADLDGCRLILSSTTKFAHTVTYAAGLGNNGAGATVLTFKATQTQSCVLRASGGFWNGEAGIVAGAATIAGVGLA